jgi:hypothetical protein
MRLGADQHDPPQEALGAQGLGCGGAGEAGANDDEGLFNGHDRPS